MWSGRRCRSLAVISSNFLCCEAAPPSLPLSLLLLFFSFFFFFPFLLPSFSASCLVGPLHAPPAQAPPPQWALCTLTLCLPWDTDGTCWGPDQTIEGLKGSQGGPQPSPSPRCGCRALLHPSPVPAAPCILPWAHLRAAFPQLVQGQDRPLWWDALYLGLFYSTFCPGSLSCVPQPRLGPFDGHFQHPVMVAGISLL